MKNFNDDGHIRPLNFKESKIRLSDIDISQILPGCIKIPSLKNDGLAENDTITNLEDNYENNFCSISHLDTCCFHNNMTGDNKNHKYETINDDDSGILKEHASKSCNDKVSSSDNINNIEISSDLKRDELPKDLITQEEAAKMLNVTARTIRTYVKKKGFKRYSLGKRPFYSKKEIISKM